MFDRPVHRAFFLCPSSAIIGPGAEGKQRGRRDAWVCAGYAARAHQNSETVFIVTESPARFKRGLFGLREFLRLGLGPLLHLFVSALRDALSISEESAFVLTFDNGAFFD